MEHIISPVYLFWFCSVHDWESKQDGWLETLKVLSHITEDVKNEFPGNTGNVMFCSLKCKMKNKNRQERQQPAIGKCDKLV